MGPRQTATRPRPRQAAQRGRRRPLAPEPPRRQPREPDEFDRKRPLYWRILTHSFTIIFVAVAVLAVVIYNLSFGKGAPPPAAANADLSTNDAIALVSRDYVTPAEAAGIAAAKKRAYEAQVRAARAARERAKKLAAERKKKAAERARAKAKAEADALVKAAANAPNPSAAQNRALGKKMNAAKGWGNCWTSLDNIWTHESNWNERAHNPYSGAGGIPQALPESKMSSAGSDYRTNPATQIAWGLSYIQARYNNPCQAWTFWQNNHWY